MIERVEIILVPKHLDIDLQQKFNEELEASNPMIERWIDLDGSGQIYLHCTFGVNKPITDINFYRIKHQRDQPDKMVRKSNTSSQMNTFLVNSIKHGN